MLHNPELSIREIMQHVPLFFRFTEKAYAESGTRPMA